MTTRRATAAFSAATLVALALVTGAAPSCAQDQPQAVAAGRGVRIEARFVDRGSGQEAAWGATGQILVPSAPADPAAARWGLVRAVASSPARQSVTLGPGGRGLIRVGREVPFAGWFLGHGLRCGQLEEGTEWRDVESAFEVEAAPGPDGALRIVLTPEFGYSQGRARRSVSFPAERAAVLAPPGVETRFAPPGELAGFYRRLLAGYDPLRRVWPVDLVLRAEPVEP